eukprot:5606007-Pyramimonas_sp.AAC.1
MPAAVQKLPLPRSTTLARLDIYSRPSRPDAMQPRLQREREVRAKTATDVIHCPWEVRGAD